MKKRQVLTNAAASVTQIVVNGVVSFVLYRFLLRSLGPEQLGIWSLVLATTSITGVANFGLSGSVVKFVAKYLARREPEAAAKIITTASVSIGAFIGLTLLLVYPFIRWLLELVVGPEASPAALGVLPFSLLSLWLVSITSVFQSGLDGAQRIDLRNILTMSGALLYLLLCLILVPRHGLRGVAFSQVAQSLALLIASWLSLTRIVPELPAWPVSWSGKIFREIIGYGVNFQVISVTAVLYDPATKALLGRFGGLAMVGYYEMASKMVQQFRALLVSANQVLVPAIAELHEKAPERIKDIYLTSYQLLTYLALPLYSMIVVCLPAVSRVWIGRYEGSFVIFGILLAAGWFLNTLNVPSYFVYLGTGDLRWNVVSHVAVGVLNAGLGFVFGVLFGGIGVVSGWVVALALGSSLIYLSYHLKNGIPLGELIPRASRPLLAASIVGAALAVLVFYEFDRGRQITISSAAAILAFGSVVALLVWLHPLRRRLAGWARMFYFEKRLTLDS